MACKQLIFVLFVFLMASSVISSPTITMEYNSTYNISMYANNEVNPVFIIPSGFNCYNYDLFTNNLTSTLYNISLVNMSSDYNISFTTITNNVEPRSNATNCSNSVNCTFYVNNSCQNQYSYDAIVISVTTGDNTISMTYNVICDESTILSPFQYGLIVLVIFTALQVVICSIYQQANSFNNKGHYVNFYSLGAYCSAIILGQILILVENHYTALAASYICLIISMVISVLSTMICLSEFLYYTRIKGFRIRIYKKFRIMDALGIALGIGLVCAWYLNNKNWILSDFLYIFIFIAIVKFIKFGSLKMAFFAYLSVAILNSTFILISQYALLYYFNNIILTIFNNPFFIFCPCINFIPNQKCSWFFISSMVYPAIVLCYLKRFDYNNSTKIYTIVFISVFLIFSSIWLVMSYLSPIIIPFDLINSPVCIVILLLFANRRGQLHTLWNGQIFDGQHKNKSEQQKQLNLILSEEKRESYKSAWFQIDISRASSGSGTTELKTNKIPLEPFDNNTSVNKSQVQRESDLKNEQDQL